jgi:hypothetical protein
VPRQRPNGWPWPNTSASSVVAELRELGAEALDSDNPTASLSWSVSWERSVASLIGRAMPIELSPDQKVVLGHLKAIGKILVVSGGVAIATILARLLGQDLLDSSVFKAPVRLAWLFFLPATIAHVFWTRFALYKMSDIRHQDADQTAGKALVGEIRSGDSMFLRGLVPRTEGVRPGSRVVEMSHRDPTTWLAYGLVVLVVIAILPWQLKDGALRWDGGLARALTLAGVALVVVVVNWLAGTLWVVMLSQLTLATDKQWAFDRLPFGSTVGIRWRSRLRIVQVLVVVTFLALLPFVLIAAF